MKNYKQILEAVNRGIKLALDDFDDSQEIMTQKVSRIKDDTYTKESFWIYENFVDLGLPSGTLWCKYNLGADSEEQAGPFFAWGETEEKEDNNFNETTYKFGGKITKYNFNDRLIELQPEDDTAYQLFHNPYNFKFNIPTKEQCEELIENTIQKWDDELVGCRFISKINNKEIFIPAVGYYYWRGISGDGNSAVIMSASRYDRRQDCCWCLQTEIDKSFKALIVRMNWGYYRSDGFQIRPIYNQK